MTYGLEYIELRVTTDGRNAFYKMALVTKPSGLTVLIKQWGKVGAKGQVKVENGSSALSRNELRDMAESKRKRGYHRVDANEMFEVGDANQIHDKLLTYGFSASPFTASERADASPMEELDHDALAEFMDGPSAELKRPSGWGDW